MKKLSEGLAAGGGKGGAPIVMSGDSITREEFGVLVARVDAIEALLDK